MYVSRMTSVSLLLLAMTRAAAAQRTWIVAPRSREFSIDAVKPIYRHDGGKGLILTAAGRFFISSRTSVTVELPYSLVDAHEEILDVDLRSTVGRFGNPWFGVEHDAGSTLIQAGVRPGIISASGGEDEAHLFNAFWSDLDHFEAWGVEVTTARILAQFGRIPGRGVFGIGRLGGSLFYHNGGGGTHDADVYADYGLRLGYRAAGVVVSASLIGRAVLTTSEGSFDDRTENRAAATLEFVGGTIQPFVEARLPLDRAARNAVRVAAVVGVAVSR